MQHATGARYMMRRRVGALPIFLAFVLFVLPALDSAADTGGSVGGGDWSSSSSSGTSGNYSSSGGGYSSSGGGYSGGGDTYSYSYSGGDSSPGGGCNGNSSSNSSGDSRSSDESYAGIIIGLTIFFAVVVWLLIDSLSVGTSMSRQIRGRTSTSRCFEWR